MPQETVASRGTLTASATIVDGESQRYGTVASSSVGFLIRWRATCGVSAAVPSVAVASCGTL